MTAPELCYLSASEAIARFKARTLSPVELVEALIARHEEVEERINATTILYHERALEAGPKGGGAIREARRDLLQRAPGDRPRRGRQLPAHDRSGDRRHMGKQLGELEAIEAEDEHTVRFDLAAPNAVFLKVLPLTTYSILPMQGARSRHLRPPRWTSWAPDPSW